MIYAKDLIALFKQTLDWLVNGDSVTITGSFLDSAQASHDAGTTTFTCTGFTQALTTGGIYLCNRSDGTRPAHAPLHDFYIQDLT